MFRTRVNAPTISDKNLAYSTFPMPDVRTIAVSQSSFSRLDVTNAHVVAARYCVIADSTQHGKPFSAVRWPKYSTISRYTPISGSTSESHS